MNSFLQVLKNILGEQYAGEGVRGACIESMRDRYAAVHHLSAFRLCKCVKTFRG